MDSKIKRLIYFASGISILVINAYMFKFVPGSFFALSSDGKDWADFGSYIGGVLGPVFAFLAFIGILYALDLQQDQIKLQQDQMKLMKSHLSLEELQRLMASASKNIDALLNSTLSHSFFYISII